MTIDLDDRLDRAADDLWVVVEARVVDTGATAPPVVRRSNVRLLVGVAATVTLLVALSAVLAWRDSTTDEAASPPTALVPSQETVAETESPGAGPVAHPGAGLVEVFEQEMEVALTSDLTCDQPYRSADSFDTMTLQLYSDRPGRRWLMRATFPDGSTYELVATGSIIYPETLSERGVWRGAAVGCEVAGGIEILGALIGEGSITALNRGPELADDEVGLYEGDVRSVATPAGEAQTAFGFVGERLSMTIAGFRTTGDGVEQALTQTMTWIVDDGVVVEHVVHDVTDGLGTVTVATSMRRYGTAQIGESAFDTSETTQLDPVARPAVDPFPPYSSPVVSVEPTVPSVGKTELAAPITKGAAGEEVIRLQARLQELGFDPGPIDGVFGAETQQAVWAYKKLVLGMPREELRNDDHATEVTPEMWLDMQEPIQIQPRRPQGTGVTHVEIYLPQQVLAVFADDAPVLVAHISSGDDREWCEEVSYDTDANGRPLDEPVVRDECGVSYTPGGVFTVSGRYEGTRQTPIGGTYNPVFFNYGIAVHGAANVPLYPASHGAIRINRALADIFPTLVDNGDRVYVWGQDGREPEEYSEAERLPLFNYRDPNSLADG